MSAKRMTVLAGAFAIAAGLMLAGCAGASDATTSSANEGSAAIEETSALEASSAPVAESSEPAPAPAQAASAIDSPEKTAAVQALSDRLEGMRECVYVYRDYSDTENHFTQRAKMSGLYPDNVADMNENWTDDPHSGTSCIRCQQLINVEDWGGWMFMNGYVPAGQTDPVLNDPETPGAGLDLTGAREIRFWARGEKGGETLDFFAMGYDWSGAPYARHGDSVGADTADKVELLDVVLTTEWQEFVIPLDQAGDPDLTCIANGFGYAIENNENDRAADDERNVVFYLDDIRYVGDIDMAQDGLMLMRSYDTTAKELRNAAFTYDNALAAMAFLSEGMDEQAAQLLDALVYAVENDRYEAGRIRNAYAAGDIEPFPGWSAGARLPGWYDPDAQAWYEDAYQVGCNVGNTSYAMLALLHGAVELGDKRYLDCACELGEWILDNCQDRAPGFLAGLDGWPEAGDDVTTPLTYKSTEHNIDAYAAFSQLYAMTGDEAYAAAAESARTFVESMYDADAKLFYTGTAADATTVDKGNIVLDAQVWSALALGEGFTPFEGALSQLDALRSAEGGYLFHVPGTGEGEDAAASVPDGFWCEGTAFTALMHLLRNEQAEAETAFGALDANQLEDGLFPAATTDGLTTGIYLSDGTPWLYGTDAHIAPTAWYVLACNEYNPYTFDDE